MVHILQRKARHFVADPVGTLRNQPQRLRAAWGRWRLTQAGVMDVVRAFQSLRPAHALVGDPGDWWFLYWQIRRRQPHMLLEFGAGSSTVVQAQALYDNALGGHLVSVDGDEAWARVTRRALPAHLKPLCTVLYRPLADVDLHGVPGWRHEGLPRVQPNFVYLDGPALTAERQVAVDLLDLEETFPPDCFIVVDDRKVQTQFLVDHFQRRYRFHWRRYRGTNPTFQLIA